jgi:hypothetical protein
MASGLHREKNSQGILQEEGGTMSQKVTVAYYSTTRGVTQQQTGGEMVYHGKIYRIAKSRFDEKAEVDFEKEIGELVDEIHDKGLEPLSGEIAVERYETWDLEDGDVWVMYRMPCVKKDG